MSQPLLETEVVDAEHVDPVAELAKRLDAFDGRLRTVEADVRTIKAILSAIQKVFTGNATPAAPTTGSASASKWDVIKQRLTQKQGQIIDLLNTQGLMTISQLAAATRSSYEGCRQMVDKLRAQGLVEKSGTSVSLKG